MAYTTPVGTVNLDLTGSYTPPVGTANLDIGATAAPERTATVAGETLAPTGAIAAIRWPVGALTGELVLDVFEATIRIAAGMGISSGITIPGLTAGIRVGFSNPG